MVRRILTSAATLPPVRWPFRKLADASRKTPVVPMFGNTVIGFRNRVTALRSLNASKRSSASFQHGAKSFWRTTTDRAEARFCMRFRRPVLVACCGGDLEKRTPFESEVVGLTGFRPVWLVSNPPMLWKPVTGAL
jgi:hypothetical protein